jgi:hypothetical protein
MKITLFACCTVLLLLIGLPSHASAQDLPYSCASGASFENAIRILMELRAGTYTVTVLGIDDFDPQIAVVTDTGRELACVDDSPGAAGYSVNLPTTGEVTASASSAQAVFNATEPSFTYVYVIVGGVGNTSGEFVLLFGPLRSTPEDAQGDPFVIGIPDSVASSGVPFTTYMFAVSGEVDPLIQMGTGTGRKPITLDGQALACDDAGTLVCYGESVPLEDFSITTPTQTVTGWYFNAMLSLPWEVIERVRTRLKNVIVLMSRYEHSGDGEYIMAVHMALGEPGN